jgi:hypothetical protein
VDGQATSSGIVFNQVGTYYWMAVYGGDNNYNGATSPCISEQVTVVNTEPSIATQLSGSEVMVGAPVNDSATLTGVTSSAGGTVTYYYSSTACGYVTEDLPGTLVSTVPVTDGVVPNSSSVSFSSPGTWYWWAFYSGDANNGSATSPCESEMLTVDAPPPPPPVTHIVIPTPTPFQSLEGATATPTQAVLGATGAPVTTPPPTSTGSNGSSNNSTPLFALLICLAFGGLGLLAVQAQRRSMRA